MSINKERVEVTLKEYLENVKGFYETKEKPFMTIMGQSYFESLIKIVEVLAEANEFYGNKNNWRVNPDYSFEYDVIDTDDTYVSGADLHEKSNKVLEVHSGGKRARKAQEKVNEIIGSVR